MFKIIQYKGVILSEEVKWKNRGNIEIKDDDRSSQHKSILEKQFGIKILTWNI